jgi:hypothetical protein
MRMTAFAVKGFGSARWISFEHVYSVEFNHRPNTCKPCGCKGQTRGPSHMDVALGAMDFMRFNIFYAIV